MTKMARDPSSEHFVGEDCWPTVLLDGVEQENVTFVDDEAGVVIKAMVDQTGAILMSGDEDYDQPVYERLVGAVRLLPHESA